MALGAILSGGETIELVGDLGAGKTQFVRGLAEGAGSTDSVQSPSFTISRVYQGSGFTIYHYDFYRLGEDIGIMKDEISEQIGEPSTVVVTEWASTTQGFLPDDRLQIRFAYSQTENERNITIKALGSKSAQILEKLK